MSMVTPYNCDIPPIQAGTTITINIGTPELNHKNFAIVKALQYINFSELKNIFLTEIHDQRESCTNNNSKVVNWFKDTFLTTNKVEDEPFSEEKQFLKWLEDNGYIKSISQDTTSSVEYVSIYLCF